MNSKGNLYGKPIENYRKEAIMEKIDERKAPSRGLICGQPVERFSKSKLMNMVVELTAKNNDLWDKIDNMKDKGIMV